LRTSFENLSAPDRGVSEPIHAASACVAGVASKRDVSAVVPSAINTPVQMLDRLRIVPHSVSKTDPHFDSTIAAPTFLALPEQCA
jgi:hypothetical protein